MARLLHGMGLVYVAGDGDAAGRSLDRRVCALLPWARVLPIPEGRDLRDLLPSQGREVVCALMDEADRYVSVASPGAAHGPRVSPYWN